MASINLGVEPCVHELGSSSGQCICNCMLPSRWQQLSMRTPKVCVASSFDQVCGGTLLMLLQVQPCPIQVSMQPLVTTSSIMICCNVHSAWRMQGMGRGLLTSWHMLLCTAALVCAQVTSPHNQGEATDIGCAPALPGMCATLPSAHACSCWIVVWCALTKSTYAGAS